MSAIQMKDIEKELAPKKKVPAFRIGDTVDVHVKITEGDKERIQIFNGVVIARKHGSICETFTVRRIVQGEGVERVFPVYSPRVVNIVVKKRGEVRRAKLYYLREKSGKSARVKELLGVVPGAETLVAAASGEPRPDGREEEPPKPETPKEKPTEGKQQD